MSDLVIDGHKVRNPDAEVSLAVFQTRLPENTLKDLVRDLHEECGGGEGIEVSESSIPGMYAIQRHNGFQNIDTAGMVRIVGAQLWAGKFAPELTRKLVSKGVDYEIRRVMTSPRYSMGQEVRPFDISEMKETPERYMGE